MPERRRLLLALALALVPYGLLAWRFDFVSDDAFISFRYSRHLAEGHGLVFNPGRPPVEGYSNFLWVVYLALFERAGLDLTVAARATSALAGALLIAAVVAVAARRAGLGFAGALATGLFLATSPAMGLWATSGLETMPAALLVFATYALLLADPARPRPWAAGLCGLGAALLRADGVGFVGLVLVAGTVLWWREGRPRGLRRALLLVAALVCAGVLALTLWRYSYYGELVPNTARVKAGFSPWRLQRGLAYLATFALVLPATAVALLATLRPGPAGSARLWLPAVVVVLGNLAYVVWVGGDFMPFGRFLLPALPFAALLFAGLWTAAPGGGTARARPALVGLSVLCVVQPALAAFDLNPVPEALRRRAHFRVDRAWQSEVERWRDMKRNTARWTLEGRALGLHTRPGESIVLKGIGAVGYYSELVIHDVHGLVTPEVLTLAEPRREASPGHDLVVEPGELFFLEPTYLSAFLVPVPPPVDGVLPWWASQLPAGWDTHPYSRMVTTEVLPLPRGGPFPEEAYLVLLRFQPWR